MFLIPISQELRRNRKIEGERERGNKDWKRQDRDRDRENYQTFLMYQSIIVTATQYLKKIHLQH